MKKLIFFLFAALLISCSQDQTTVDEPTQDNPAQSELTYDKVEPASTDVNISFNGNEVLQINKFNEISFTLNQQASNRLDDIFVIKDGNYSLSPVSLLLCLDLMANTVDAPFDDAVAQEMGFNGHAEMHLVANKLLRYLPAEELGARMVFTNAVWYNNLYNANADYVKKMRNEFFAPVTAVNFFTQEKTADLINRWASENTNGVIERVIDPTNIFPDNLAIFANAMYFESEWDGFGFHESMNEKLEFNGLEKTSVIDFMTTKHDFKYAADGDFEMLDMSFNGRQYAIDFIMPREGLSIDQAAGKLTYEAFMALKGKLASKNIDLRLPKFKLSHKADLNKLLVNLENSLIGAQYTMLGVPGNIAQDSNKLTQYTGIDVCEGGVRAAAVTINMSAGANFDAPTPEYSELTIDRPFFYLIRDVKTGAIIMIGRVANL